MSSKQLFAKQFLMTPMVCLKVPTQQTHSLLMTFSTENFFFFLLIWFSKTVLRYYPTRLSGDLIFKSALMLIQM